MQLKRILFPQWGSIGQDFIVRAWRDEGYEAELFEVPMAEPDPAKREALAGEMVKKLLSGAYEGVFTVNYLPVVAIACKACRVRYVSWVYDSPCVELYSETAAYETNRIFVFDRQVCRDLCAKGLTNIFYLPLAADVDYYDRMDSDRPARRADCAAISFVGSLYLTTARQFAPLEAAEGYLKGYLDGLIEAQLRIHSSNFLEPALTPPLLREMQNLCPLTQRVNSGETAAWLYANYYLAPKVTGRERVAILRGLAKQFAVALYSGDSTAQFPELANRGIAEYYRMMPLVFKNSKINLNISLRSIHSGIPLRAFDIMGCGGFLLTNYQADFLEHFVPDEDFVYYESFADLADKAAFYLAHEEQRKQIARNGYEKVRQFHTYRHRIREILRIAGFN